MEISKYENNGLYVEISKLGLHVSYRYGDILPYSNGSKNKTKELFWYPFSESVNGHKRKRGFFEFKSYVYDEIFFLKQHLNYWQIFREWKKKYITQITVDGESSGKNKTITDKIVNGMWKQLDGKIPKREILHDVDMSIMVDLILKRVSKDENRNKSGGDEG